MRDDGGVGFVTITFVGVILWCKFEERFSELGEMKGRFAYVYALVIPPHKLHIRYVYSGGARSLDDVMVE